MIAAINGASIFPMVNTIANPITSRTTSKAACGSVKYLRYHEFKYSNIEINFALCSLYPWYLEMQCSECVCFYSRQGATMPHGRPLQRGATLPWMKTGVLWILHFQASWVYTYQCYLDRCTLYINISELGERPCYQ